MTVLYIVLAAVLLSVLIGLLRAGVKVCFDENGLRVLVRLGPALLQIYPSLRRAKKQGKEKRKREKKPGRGREFIPQTAAGKYDLFRQFLPVITRAAGGFKKKLRIDTLQLHLIWGASDPAEAAAGYGRACAAMGMVWPLFEHNFNVKDYDLHVDVSYTQPGPSVRFSAQTTLSVWQATRLVSATCLHAAKTFMQFRKTQKNEKAVQQA